MGAVVDDFVPDDEINAIKLGHPRTLFVWGKVTYLDVFGERRYTDFAHSMHWRGDNVWGTHAREHNWQA